MIGIVEIYKNFGTPDQELVHKDNNLVVDGAGALICDLLTTASGSVSCAETSGILDSSNFTIQAMSFGKASAAYKKNAHFFPFETSSYLVSGLPYHGYVNLVKKDHIVRATSLNKENITYTTSSYDPENNVGSTPNPTDIALELNTKTAIDVRPTQIHSMGNDHMTGRAPAYGHNLNRLVSNSNPNLISYTLSPEDDPTFGSTNIYWTKGTHVSSLSLSTVHSGPFYGTSSFHVSGGGSTGIVMLRQDSYQSAYGKAKRYFHENVDHTLSLYVLRPNIGTGDPFSTAPSAITLNIRATNAAGATTANNKVEFFTSGEGTFDSPFRYAVAIEPSTGKGGVDILGVGATDGDVGWQRLHGRVSGLAGGSRGDYVTPIVYFTNGAATDSAVHQYGWQLEESWGPTDFRPVSGIQPNFVEGGLDGDIFLGCYPDSSGTEFSITRGDNKNLGLVDPGASNIASGIYPDTPDRSFFNSSSVRSMDQNGFIRTYNSILGGLTDSTSGVIVSANSDFSSTGEVSYTCTISSGDLGLANMYGGVFKCGLWSVDLPNTLQGNITHPHDGESSLVYKNKYPRLPSLEFKAGCNNLVYKLFAEKSFTSNLARIKDNGTDAGCLNYSPLTFVWRIQFV